MQEVLERWFNQVTSLVLSVTGDRANDADANISVFSVSDAQAANVSTRQLNNFLLRAYRHYSRKLSRAPTQMWFYAWHDEMSGTLRCSACPLSSSEHFPFACKLNVVNAPNLVSAGALESHYSAGMPSNELVPEEIWKDGEEAVEFVLTVFARPLIVEA